MTIMSSGKAAGIDSDAAGQAQQQAIGEILQVAQPLADVGIGRLAEPRAHVVEGALHARFAGEARSDRLAHPLDPAAVVGEHAEGLEDLAVLARLHVVGLEQTVDVVAHGAQRLLEPRLLDADILGDHALDDDARLVQHGVADRDARRELHTVDAQRQQAQAIDLLHFIGTDDVSRRDHFRQHHGDGLQRLDLFLVVEAPGAVLHDQHAEHPPRAHDRHAGQRMVDLLTRFRAIGELRMALRIVERQRTGVRGDVADQALADPQARAMHGRGIEALGSEQLEDFAGAQQVDRADLGHHLVGDQAHDLAQGFLGRGATRHRVPEPLEEHSRSGQGSPSLHGQTARCLSRITTKLRSMMQAQTRHAADWRALVAARWLRVPCMARL